MTELELWRRNSRHLIEQIQIIKVGASLFLLVKFFDCKQRTETTGAWTGPGCTKKYCQWVHVVTVNMVTITCGKLVTALVITGKEGHRSIVGWIQLLNNTSHFVGTNYVDNIPGRRLIKFSCSSFERNVVVSVCVYKRKSACIVCFISSSSSSSLSALI